MDLRQLRSFLALAEELHFGHAARRVHVSQPAPSQQLRNLEETLGVRLIDRSTRQASLTAAGAVFARGARAVLRELDLAAAAARLADRGGTGTLTIALNELGGQQPVVGRCLRLFRSTFPGIVLRLADLGEAAQYDALQSGAIDLGFHYRVSGSHAGFAARVLDRQDYRLLVPRDHELAAAATVTLADVARHPLIMLRRAVNADTHDGIMRAFAAHALTPEIVLEASSDASMLSLVDEGLGLAIVMGAHRRGGWQGLVLQPVDGLSLAKDFVVAWHAENRSPTLARFLALLEETVDRPVG